MVLSLILSIILFVSLAMLIREGLWTNALTLVNVLVAATVATNLWEPLADWLDGQVPGGTYLWDFISIWVLFCAAFVVMRVVTDLASRVRFRFRRPVDFAGGLICAVLVGWALVCFTSATLHMTPLKKDFISSNPGDKIMLGMFAPDRQWFGWFRGLASGTFRAGGEEAASTFPPTDELIGTYAERRANYENVAGILAE
jgi:uncharacterized membrane protein required for colicin V production